MTVFIVGTGRCGTKTLATVMQERGLDSRHESSLEVLAELAPKYSINPQIHPAAVKLLREWCRFGEVEANYKLSELIVPLREAYPGAEFMWVHRRPLDCVTSMVRKDWYADEDEQLLPVSLQWWEFGERVAMMFDVNWRAFRTAAPLVGEMSLRDWRALGQAGRCAWWWDWCNRRIALTIPEGSRRVPIESVERRVNVSRGRTLTPPEVRLVEELCSDGELVLYG